MGFELLLPPPSRRAASRGHVCAVAERVTALATDRMSGTSDAARKKMATDPPLPLPTLHFFVASFNLLLLFFHFDSVSLYFPPFRLLYAAECLLIPINA